MTRTSLHVRVAALGAGALVLSACGSNSDAAPSDSVSQPPAEPTMGIIGAQTDCGEPVEGGTLTLADYAEARSLNPTQTIATGYSGGTALAAIYDVLVRYDPETGEFEPWLAEDVQPNEDFTEWTVTLRDGVTFSDGTPLNAEAVVNSVNWYLSNGGFDAAIVAPNLSGVRAEGDNTVVFELNKPWASFPAMLGQGIGMIVAPAATQGEFQPIGAGPFTLDSYSPQEELVLSAREDYWGDEPYLDELRFVWLNNEVAALETLQSGGVDATVLRGITQVEEAREAGFPGYLTVQSLGNIALLNNAEGRPAADPRVREAIALAIDTEVLNQRVWEGIDIGSKALFPEISRWHAEDVETRPFDPERARQLVEEAKADGWDGTITYLGGDDPAGRAQALAIQAMLENVGITAETELLRTIADRIQRIFVQRDFDMAQSALSVTEEDPFQRLYSSLHSNSATNVMGYANPEMDALILELQATSGEDRQEIIAEIEALWQETVPSVSFAPSVPFVPWQEDVHGIEPINEGMLMFGDAWIGEC
ncbi:ABC transporter substrate-binding protein [Geodermatophilus sp. DF01_2]|uniref:ABC transporter substrate-binding protein n=1 Tax=Geodermatophilus sp. DF01-2 TaxID=2559610 RepID=UPI001ADDDF10|nr:ABC transporter substrate-binding protein [Geodermatophilus sp. DF01_2]